MAPRQKLASQARMIVIKVGTSVITGEGLELDLGRMGDLARQICDLKKRGKEVILVTSGAIGAGMGKLGLAERPEDLRLRQASAAVGQSILMHYYEILFDNYKQTVAQLLLTKEDFSDPERSRNLRNTLETLLRFNVIPIVNENDVVSIHELKNLAKPDAVTKITFGDNDTLAALIANRFGADLLIILSDVDGLYDLVSAKGSRRNLIRTVTEVTPSIEKLARGEGGLGRGGMTTKIQAAKTVAERGGATIIANGREENVISRIMKGEVLGTIFLPKEGSR
jgi:glutamate 5-kinase